MTWLASNEIVRAKEGERNGARGGLEDVSLANRHVPVHYGTLIYLHTQHTLLPFKQAAKNTSTRNAVASKGKVQHSIAELLSKCPR